MYPGPGYTGARLYPGASCIGTQHIRLLRIPLSRVFTDLPGQFGMPGSRACTSWDVRVPVYHRLLTDGLHRGGSTPWPSTRSPQPGCLWTPAYHTVPMAQGATHTTAAKSQDPLYKIQALTLALGGRSVKIDALISASGRSRSRTVPHGAHCTKCTA